MLDFKQGYRVLIANEVLIAIAQDLEGTCQMIDVVVERHGVDCDDLTTEEFLALDEHIICCSCCGWWVDANEVGDLDICSECSPDEGGR